MSFVKFHLIAMCGLVACLSTCWAACITSVETDNQQNSSMKFEDLIEEVGKYNCSTPVPKLIYLKRGASEKYHPPCVVLHRCSNDTGCCWKNSKICDKIKSENVTLPIQVINSTKQRTDITMTFENHTSCGCMDKPFQNL
uniref:U19-Liphistoxin-Lsp1a_1 n=1 Tax=Liphistius sp. SGP-2016 TaxID=1905180 RepID=A0A4V2H8Y7_9ARAC